MVVLFICPIVKIYAQPIKAPMFGKDIVLSDIPSQDQSNVAICSASNGLMYAGLIYRQSNQRNLVILKTEDHGFNWSVIYDEVASFAYVIKDFNMVLNGASSNLKLFLGWITYDTINNIGTGHVLRFNANTAQLETFIDLGVQVNGLTLATDYMFPPSSTSSYTIGLLYSKRTSTNDTIFFCSSEQGNLNFSNKRVVATTPASFKKVGLSYGYSPQLNTGRYFATWERQASLDDSLGSIFTAHSEPNFDSPFTAPVCLDCFEPSIAGKVRNPFIAVQCGNSESDSSDLTQVVVFEKYDPASGQYDIMGAYNLQSTSGSYYQLTTINGPVSGRLTPDIVYNPYISSYTLTFLDQNTGKLPFFTNSVNLISPANWNVITNGYNDSVVSTYAQPVIAVDHGQHSGLNAWLGKRNNQNRVALFDFPNSTYTWSPPENNSDQKQGFNVYPNPCSENFSMEFNLKRSQLIKVDLISPEGKVLSSLYNGLANPGMNTINLKLSERPAGIYFISLQSEDYSVVKKIVHITN